MAEGGSGTDVENKGVGKVEEVDVPTEVTLDDPISKRAREYSGTLGTMNNPEEDQNLQRTRDLNNKALQEEEAK